MLKSSIDLGTNTCLLLIAEVEPETGAVIHTVRDEAQVVRLGQGVDQARAFHPDAMARTLTCLKNYSQWVRDAGLNPAETFAVGTSQARDSKNATEFFEQIRRETGFQFRTLSGDQEAQATFLGAILPGMNAKNSVVIDIGGGSTEYMGSGSGSLSGQSLDLGSVRFTERFLKTDPVTDQEFWSCQECIDRELAKLIPWRKHLGTEVQLVGVAGTITTLAQWFLGKREFKRDEIDQVTLTRGDIHRMVEELKWRSVSERQTLPGVTAGRADVLLAGALILWRSMEILNFSHCRVSTRGLRYGVLLKEISQ